jgi:hypothetical protein
MMGHQVDYQDHEEDHEEEQEEDDEMGDDGEDQEDGHEDEIIPNSHPPEVPEEGTYIDALNEAGVD